MTQYPLVPQIDPDRDVARPQLIALERAGDVTMSGATLLNALYGQLQPANNFIDGFKGAYSRDEYQAASNRFVAMAESVGFPISHRDSLTVGDTQVFKVPNTREGGAKLVRLLQMIDAVDGKDKRGMGTEIQAPPTADTLKKLGIGAQHKELLVGMKQEIARNELPFGMKLLVFANALMNSVPSLAAKGGYRPSPQGKPVPAQRPLATNTSKPTPRAQGVTQPAQNSVSPKKAESPKRNVETKAAAPTPRASAKLKYSQESETDRDRYNATQTGVPAPRTIAEAKTAFLDAYKLQMPDRPKNVAIVTLKDEVFNKAVSDYSARKKEGTLSAREASEIGGFEDKGVVYLRAGGSATTALHELAHAYCNRTFEAKFHFTYTPPGGHSVNLNEGFTQYLAEQVPGYVAVAGVAKYPAAVKFVRELKDKVGEKTIRNAYFNGDPKSIEKIENAIRRNDPQFNSDIKR
jgi:hypothetical protein